MWAVTLAASLFYDEDLQLSVLPWALYMDLTYLQGSGICGGLTHHSTPSLIANVATTLGFPGF